MRIGLWLSKEDLARMRDGVWPRAMDQRWAIWLDPTSTLRCWRTGVCIYEAEVELGPTGNGAIRVLNVLDNPQRYRRALSERGEIERFEGVLSLARSATR